MPTGQQIGQGVSILSDLANLGFGIYDRISGSGTSDTAVNDQRFMNDFAWKAALRNEDYQKNYMQYRSADALAAGMHPLAALGVNVGSGPSAAAFTGVDTHRARGYSDMSNLGQNTIRSLMSQATEDDRALARANINRTNAETDLIRSQHAESMKRLMEPAGNPPGAPTGRDPTDPIQKYHYYVDENGNIIRQYSPAYSQAIMSDPLGMWANSFEKSFAGPDNRPFYRKMRKIALPWLPE